MLQLHGLILLVVIIIVFGILIFKGIEKHERVECIKWQQEKLRFEDIGWYPTEWQKQQCKEYNIEL